MSSSVFGGLCMALGSLSANSQGCVPIFWSFGIRCLVLDLAALGWYLVLVLRWRHLGEFLLINVLLGLEFSSGLNSWTRVSHLRAQAQLLTAALRLYTPHNTEDKTWRLTISSRSLSPQTLHTSKMWWPYLSFSPAWLSLTSLCLHPLLSGWGATTGGWPTVRGRARAKAKH